MLQEWVISVCLKPLNHKQHPCKQTKRAVTQKAGTWWVVHYNSLFFTFTTLLGLRCMCIGEQINCLRCHSLGSHYKLVTSYLSWFICRRWGHWGRRLWERKPGDSSMCRRSHPSSGLVITGLTDAVLSFLLCLFRCFACYKKYLQSYQI